MPEQSVTPAPLALRDRENGNALELVDDGGVNTPVAYAGIGDRYVILQPRQVVELRVWAEQWLKQREVIEILNDEEQG